MVGSDGAIVIDGAVARPETFHVIVAGGLYGRLAVSAFMAKGFSQRIAYALDENGGIELVPLLETLVYWCPKELGRFRKLCLNLFGL